MSKNSTLKDTIEESLDITEDEVFKNVVRYKAIAAIIVKGIIPEFYDKLLLEVAKSIINTKDRKGIMSNTAILEDQVDLMPAEAGTKDEKKTVNDAVFRVRLHEDIIEIKLKCIDREITVNTEMQRTTLESRLGYNLISRAVYYGASLLRDTVPAGDTEYTNIHKVYTRHVTQVAMLV